MDDRVCYDSRTSKKSRHILKDQPDKQNGHRSRWPFCVTETYTLLHTEAASIFAGKDKGPDHLGLLIVTIEHVEFLEPEVIATQV